ncbi:MAG: hypothetical protein ACKOEC_10090 [Acidimicrobiia bacterium]
MRRATLILIAVVLAAAAPLRAWCEAGCLAPVHAEGAATPSHCQLAEPDTSTTSLAGVFVTDCPTAESARPITWLELAIAPAVTPAHPSTPEPRHLRPATKPSGYRAVAPSGPLSLRI